MIKSGIRKSTEQFITKARLVHGNKYDYSKVNYISAHKKIIIICPEHGEFSQTPNGHIKKHGCIKCGIKKSSKSVLLTLEQFVDKARLVHGNKYDYSKVIYKNNQTKIIIICPEHGEFLQRPNEHLLNHGCYKCGIIKFTNKNKMNLIKFVDKARLVHGNKYDYSKIKNFNYYTKTTIICPEHGEFLQTPHNHLLTIGCPECNQERHIKMMNTKRWTNEQFIQKAKTIHDNKYDYSKVEYGGIRKKVIIICPEHGKFLQTPHSHINGHLKGSGCPECNKSFGEEKIKTFLLNENIYFVSEKSFPDLRGVGGGLLRFDFYLPSHNICIEYDGPQHYNVKYMSKIYSENDYNRIKNHDRKKSRYCRKQGIKLIRIPYYKHNQINQILKDQIRI